MFQGRLCIVKITVYTDHFQVRSILGHHLQALHIGGTTVRIETGDLDILLVFKGIQRCRTGVATGCGEDQIMLITL